MEYTMINAFGALVEYFALYAFLWIFFEADKSKKVWRATCHVMIPILFFLFSTFVSNIYIRPILFVVCTIPIAYGFAGNRWSRFFSVALFQIILILIEISISFQLQPMQGISQESFYLAINAYMKLGTVAIILILFFISRKKQIVFKQLKTEYVLMLLMFSVVSLLIVSYLEYLLMMLGNLTLFINGFIIILLTICVNVALYFLFYQLANGEEAKMRLQFIDFHLKQQKEQQDYMEHNYREMRKLSHDIDKYLTAVYKLLEQNKLREAMSELEKRKLEIGQSRLFDTGYPLLNSVLAYKFRLAQEKSIQTQLFWNLNNKIELDLTDLSVVLSNALDNAIEAAAKVENTRPFIAVRAEEKGFFLKLNISNNAVAAPVIENGKIVTTKEDKWHHGLGLESIQTIAHRYDGESFTEYKNNIFTLTIIMKNISLKAK